MTLEFLQALLEKQRECCAICNVHWTACVASRHCRTQEIFLARLFVDHCHSTGQVRGLLCNKCNVAIALLDEDLERFDA
ncbi:MAG: endonuclease domain-containing protein, partial [Candidatus Baltobacteraceae bacterium]